jgi:hydroxymethylbilane synthase
MALRLRIGSRPSPLALIQAHAISQAIEGRVGAAAIEIVPISTTGDKMTTASLARIGGKGLFVRELEQALADGRIDIAVHSLKDLPAVLPDQFRIAAVPPREDPRDGLLLRGGIASADVGQPWRALRHGARVGTSSSRRKYELLRQRPDLQIEPLRGNVDTRLRRLAEGDFDAIMLAIAGLKRLGRIDPPDGISIVALDDSEFVPAGGQGALAIEALRDGIIADAVELEQAVAALDDLPTRAEVTAERGFLAAIGASCVSPVGVKGAFREGRFALRALLFSIDGSKHLAETFETPLDPADDQLEDRAREYGEALGRRMLTAGGDALIGEA